VSKRPYRPLKAIKYDSNTARFGGKYIIFRADYFIRDLGKVVEKTIQRVGELIVQQSKRNIAAIRFHIYPIKLAGSSVPVAGLRKFGKGYEVTDNSRKKALINSIVLGEIKRRADARIGVLVRTMVSNFKDSHIGIYYEYGTGQYQSGGWVDVKGQKYEHNPLRSGNYIYTRPGQVWTDLGGNTRISSAGKLRRLDGFAVPAYYWFSNAVKEADKSFVKIFEEEFSVLDVRKYLQIKSKIILGGGR
jgi:hypothetical protein